MADRRGGRGAATLSDGAAPFFDRKDRTYVNLTVIESSRRVPRPGDIFVVKPRGHAYYFGRVIKLVPAMLLGYAGPLVYIYRVSSRRMSDIPMLRRDELMIPPLGTNRLPWSKGYFHTVGYRELTMDDILPTHCFYCPIRQQYFDEEGHRLPRRIEPCGFFGLDSYRTIDDAISKVLGIPLLSNDVE